MSFNLKEKQARLSIANNVQSIESRLEKIYDDYRVLRETTEANLDDSRVNVDPDFTIGSGVSSKHVGTKEAVVEKKLDTEKSMFTKHRQNVSGDVPKLEEKRLSGNPSEKEKYQSANKKE